MIKGIVRHFRKCNLQRVNINMQPDFVILADHKGENTYSLGLIGFFVFKESTDFLHKVCGLKHI